MSTRRKKVDKEAIRRKRAITETLYLPADEDQQERYEQAAQHRKLAVFAGQEDEIRKATEKLDGIKAEIEETGLVLTFKAVGRKRWDAILLEHPPTDEQKDEDKKLPEAERRTFDPEAFWPALLAETVLSELDADEWRAEVFESPEWNGAELALLRDAAHRVNATTRVADLGN